jgi:hypothetical protein
MGLFKNRSFYWRERIVAVGTMKNFEPCPFPVNTDGCPAMRADKIAFIAGINKPVYSSFFIGKPAVKLIVRHCTNRSFRFIGHFLLILLSPYFLGVVFRLKIDF